MRPVNLLPQKHRPHQADGSKAGSAYVVVGVLAVLLVMAVVYVLQTNKIAQAKTDTATAEQRTAEARAKATQNGPYANFAQVKDARVSQVKQLADSRFDWERTLRELSLVLPDGVWIQDVTAATNGAADTAAGATPTAAGNPTIAIHGCAYRQPQVAETILRLKQLDGVSDVTLDTSARTASDEKKKTTSDSAGSGASSSGCGTHGDSNNYDFKADVEFTAPAATTSTTDQSTSKIPVRLGGGS
jgi:Tfp pilus assembly protein PilN